MLDAQLHPLEHEDEHPDISTGAGVLLQSVVNSHSLVAGNYRLG